MANRTEKAASLSPRFARIKEIGQRILTKASQDNLPRLASSFSFFALLSVSPFLVLAVSVAGLFIGKASTTNHILAEATSVGGPQVRDYVASILTSVHHGSTSLLATGLSLVVTFYSASNLFVQLDDAVNTIWELRDKRTFFVNLIVTRLVAFLSVLLFGSVLLGWLVLDGVLGWIAHNSGEYRAWDLISLLVTIIFLTFAFSVTYKVLPRGLLRFREAVPGGLLTGVGIALSKYILAVYFSRATGVYGAAGGIVIVLLWMYYSSVIYFFGIEVNFALAKERTESQALTN